MCEGEAKQKFFANWLMSNIAIFFSHMLSHLKHKLSEITEMRILPSDGIYQDLFVLLASLDASNPVHPSNL